MRHAGQAQKEIVHNEALAIIDLLLHGSVVETAVDMPPASPVPGQCWIVGPSPAAAWAGQGGMIAGWTIGGWRFVAPRAGMRLWDEGAGCPVTHDGSDWSLGILDATAIRVGGVQVVGAQQAAIPDPAGGAVADAEARTAIDAMLASLRAHGLIAP